MTTRFVLAFLTFSITAWAQQEAPKGFQLRGDRFAPLTWDQLSDAQKAFINEVMQGANPTVAGPYNMLLRSPDLGVVAHRWGAYPRFRSTITTRLNELAIMMAARSWNSEFVWFAHRGAAERAGLKKSVGDAIVAGTRPSELAADEEIIYNFCEELLAKKQVSDANFAAMKGKFGEQGIVDLISGMAYFQYLSMMMNVDRYPLPANVAPAFAK